MQAESKPVIPETVDWLGFRSKLDHESHGIVTGPDGERYNWLHGKVDYFSRYKYLRFSVDGYRYTSRNMIIGGIPKWVALVIHRIWDVARFGFYRRAELYSRIEVRKILFRARAEGLPTDSPELKTKMSRIRFYQIVICLGKDLVKIVTSPAYLVAVECFFVLGCLLPKLGRMLVAKVQRLWEFDNLLERTAAFAGTRNNPTRLDFFNSSMVHYIAPCYQSLDDFDRLHLYLNLAYHHRTLRSVWSRLDHELATYKVLFPPDLFKEFESALVALKNDIKQICPKNEQELRENENKEIELIPYLESNALRTSMDNTFDCLQRHIDGTNDGSKTLSDLKASFVSLKGALQAYKDEKARKELERNKEEARKELERKEKKIADFLALTGQNAANLATQKITKMRIIGEKSVVAKCILNRFARIDKFYGVYDHPQFIQAAKDFSEKYRACKTTCQRLDCLYSGFTAFENLCEGSEELKSFLAHGTFREETDMFFVMLLLKSPVNVEILAPISAEELAASGLAVGDLNWIVQKANAAITKICAMSTESLKHE